jgi:internalin A
VVDRLCDEATKRGHPIQRDQTAMRVGNDIAAFMKRISEGDRVFVVLSEKYLKSAFCIFELYETWRCRRMESEEFLKVVRVYSLADAQIWTSDDRAHCAKFWEQEQARLTLDLKYLGERDLIAWGQMGKFSRHLGDILQALANIRQPRSWEELVEYGFNDLPPSR